MPELLALKGRLSSCIGLAQTVLLYVERAS